MKTSVKSIGVIKITLLLRTLCGCLLFAAFVFAAIPTRAGDAEDKAKQAFADWKAANKAVADAKDALEKARAKQQIEMDKARGRKKKKKKDDAQDKQLEEARAEAAAAEAALEKAEAALVAARIALEKAIAELPDGDLKDQLKRERNFPSLVTANGLHTVKFDTPSGQLTVNLPDDMRAGDTISGTVIAEPKGQTKEERAKNQSELNSLVVEIDGKPVEPFSGDSPKERESVIQQIIYHLDRPEVQPAPNAPATSRPMPISLVNSAGKEIARTTISTSLKNTGHDANAPLFFNIPPLGQMGRPIVITGPFDGNSSNTTITASALRTTVQDFEKNTENVSGGFGLLAESPRKAVFQSPANVTGPMQITVNEAGKQTTGNYRNVGVNLSAPKTSLLKGESTTMRVEVSGLEGIKQPVPLTLESRGVISMAGGAYQPLVIQPSQVGVDGRYSTTRGVTGVQAGGWSATATVLTYSWSMDVKIEGENCDRHLRFNSSTGDYTFNCPGCSYVMSDGTLMTREQFAVFSNAPMGRGTVTQKGCIITLEHNAPDRRVMATIDQCTKSGTATVDVPANKAKFTITDRDTSDNTCAVP